MNKIFVALLVLAFVGFETPVRAEESVTAETTAENPEGLKDGLKDGLKYGLKDGLKEGLKNGSQKSTAATGKKKLKYGLKNEKPADAKKQAVISHRLFYV
ncbi:MAG: hypothetical protein KH347_04580 [Acetobacter sp.]|nr:hypothetical protein [Acetobacter sp.]